MNALELTHHSLSADKARTLLRKLRDLNLCAGPIAITRGLSVIIAGCISHDGPAENGVRYRLQLPEGLEHVLELAWCPAGLDVSIGPPARTSERRAMRVQLTCDRKGRVCAQALGARVRADSIDRRELEHFLRRVVRTACNGGLRDSLHERQVP